MNEFNPRIMNDIRTYDILNLGVCGMTLRLMNEFNPTIINDIRTYDTLSLGVCGMTSRFMSQLILRDY